MAIKLRIDLLRVRPKVWRRVVVPATLTVGELHSVIQGAMGWEDDHLHSFEIGNRRFGMPIEDSLLFDMAEEDERLHRLVDVVKPRLKFVYTYDFGDDWIHRVTVEDMDADAGGKRTPHCVAGACACPPEDCGGPFGYARLLDVMADEAHPLHGELAEWYGTLDPEAFDLEAANRRIDRMAAIYRKRFGGSSRKAR